MADPPKSNTNVPPSKPLSAADVWNDKLNQQTQADCPASPSGTRPVGMPSANLYGGTLADAGAKSPTLGTAPKIPIASNYQVLALIGEGGMGTVTLAFDNNLKRYVALKRIAPEHVSNDKLHRRFLTEAQACSKLLHHHIVQVFQLGEDQEGLFIAMEYVGGPLAPRRADWPKDLPKPPLDLEEMVRLKGKLDVSATVKLGRQLLSAIRYAHQNHIIHRDIKPANILLSEQWEPKLADFGLARQVDLLDEGKTNAGAQLLTLGYGAPEQESDASKADHRADLYALGATLWYVLTGQNPRFFRESEVPLALRQILLKALEKDREKRFKDATEFDQALEKLNPTLAASSTSQGECPKCRHIHLVEANKLSNLKFCEQCGHSLQELCLKCNQNNWVWVKYCSSCGGEVAAYTQTCIQKFQTELKKTEETVKADLFDKALQTVDRLSKLTHPKLRSIADEAKATLPKIQKLFAAAQQNRDQRIRQAQHLIEIHDYEKAVQVLLTVSFSLRNELCNKTLAIAQQNSEELKTLDWEIENRFKAGRYSGLKDMVLRVLVLRPLDAYHQQLLCQLEENARRERIGFWKHTFAVNTVSAYEEFLSRYPESKKSQTVIDAFSAALREELMREPNRRGTRRRYLEFRNDAQLSEDENRASQSLMTFNLLLGMVGGLLLGAILAFLTGSIGKYINPNGPTRWVVGVIGAIVGGVAGGLVLSIMRNRR